MDPKLRKYLEGISVVNHNKIFQRYLFNHSHDELIKNNTNTNIYFKKITNTTINSQGDAGTCWLYTYTNIFTRKYIQKYRLNNNFKLSISYLLFYHLFEECLKSIKLIENAKELNDIDHVLEDPVDDGGSFFQFRKLVKKYGLVPRSCFEHSFSTKNTNEVIKILRYVIRNYAIQKLHNNKKINSKKIQKNIIRTLFLNFGIPPNNFTWKYTNISNCQKYMFDIDPIQFKDLVDIDLDNFEYLSFDENIEEKRIKCSLSEDYIDDDIDYYHNHKFDPDIIDKIKKVIDSNNPVVIKCDTERICSSDNIFHHKHKNYLDLYMIDMNSMNREEMFLSGEVDSNHVMMITGYSDDLFLIDNSWGKQYYASYDFVLKFVSIFIIL